MNIKKLASLALAGTMVVSLAACGGTSGDSSSKAEIMTESQVSNL